MSDDAKTETPNSTLTPAEARARFWTEMQQQRAAMLGIDGARHVPMAPYAREDDGAVWFITAEGTDLAAAAGAGPGDALLIVTGNGDFHARIEGRATLSQDRAKLEELWNPVASSWFDGIDDPDIRLIRVAPREAELWLTPGGFGFFLQIAKSKITGRQPDMGETLTVTF